MGVSHRYPVVCLYALGNTNIQNTSGERCIDSKKKKKKIQNTWPLLYRDLQPAYHRGNLWYLPTSTGKEDSMSLFKT